VPLLQVRRTPHPHLLLLLVLLQSVTLTLVGTLTE
jgi:hypothetical protein